MPSALKYGIISAVATVAIYVLSLFARLLFPETLTLDPTLFAFCNASVAFMVGMLVTILTNISKQDDEIKKLLASTKKEVLATIEQDISFRVVGTPSDAIQYLLESLPDAVRVDNTYIRFKDYSLIDDRIYPKDWQKTVVKTIREFCSGVRPRIWRDVISATAERNNLVSEIASDASITQYLRKIVDEMPVINYIIMYKENDAKEVLFGWASLKDYPSQTLVFSTTNKELANYFVHHFNMLFNAGRDG